jgi:hypothetical protein
LDPPRRRRPRGRGARRRTLPDGCVAQPPDHDDGKRAAGRAHGGGRPARRPVLLRGDLHGPGRTVSTSMRPAPRSARAAARPTRPTATAAGRAPTGLIRAPTEPERA